MSELIKSLNEKYSVMNKQIADIKEKMCNESKQYIEQACKELFDACPEVHQIHWTQYTPYFNDGESCEFSVNEVCFVLTDDLEDGEWEDGFYEGSTLYDSEDVRKAEVDLETAKEFNADPEAWRKKKYGTKYTDEKDRMDRGHFSGLPSWRIPHVLNSKPYPSDVDDAQERLDKLRNKVEAMGDRADIISTHVKGVTGFIQSIDEDVMESLFGNHVSIVITRDGMEIDEYDHD